MVRGKSEKSGSQQADKYLTVKQKNTEKTRLKKELLSRLPDGCSPDDDLPDRIAGGLARTYDAKIIRPPFPKGQARGLADKGDLALVLSDRYLLPDKFASLADMEQWFADNLA